MAKKTARCGEYTITVNDDGAIEVYRIYENVKGALREIAEKQGFEYDSQWTTQQFGAKIVKEYGDGKMANVGNYVVTKDEKNHIEVSVHTKTQRRLCVRFPKKQALSMRPHGLPGSLVAN